MYYCKHHGNKYIKIHQVFGTNDLYKHIDNLQSTSTVSTSNLASHLNDLFIWLKFGELELKKEKESNTSTTSSSSSSFMHQNNVNNSSDENTATNTMDAGHGEPADDNNDMTLHIDTIINETQDEAESKSCNDRNNSNGGFLLEMATQPPTIHGNICISAPVSLYTYININYINHICMYTNSH